MSIKTSSTQPPASRPRTALPSKPITSSTKTYKASKTDAADLAELDACLSHISETIIQKSPYILTVPTDAPFELHPYQITDWRRGCPFDKNEEQLQYMSFLPRDGLETCLRVIGGWDDGNGEIVKEGDGFSSKRSVGEKTPLQSQNKNAKKITLSDYKSKKEIAKGGKPGQTESKAMGEKTLEKKAVNGVAERVIKAEQVSLIPGHKRNHSSLLERPSSQNTKPNLERLEKRQRTNSSAPKPDTRVEERPAKIEKAADFKLPLLLSPTLPPEIEAELAKREAQKAKLARQAISDKKKQHIGPVDTSRKAPSPLGNAKPANKTSSQSEKRPPPPEVLVPASQKYGDDADDDQEDVEPARPTCIVILKFRRQKQAYKRLTPWLERIIKRPPKHVAAESSRTNDRKPTPTPEPVRDAAVPSRKVRPREASVSHLPDAQQGITSIEKRRREDDKRVTEQPLKRPKLSSSTASAPVISNKSPIPTKQRPSTPVNSTSRLAQVDGPVSTPKSLRMVATPHGPPSTERLPNNSSTNGTRDVRSENNGTFATIASEAEYKAWLAKKRKYLDLGRELKHEAEKIFKEERSGQSKPAIAKSERLANAITVETMLCYILGFTAQEESARANRSPLDTVSWETTVAYIKFGPQFFHEPERDHFLRGLVLQLEAVCRQRLQVLYANELYSIGGPVPTPAPASTTNGANGANTGAAPTATANGSMTPTTLQEKFDHYRSVSAKMQENTQQMQRCWIDGTTLLSWADLRDTFPETMRKATENPISRNSSSSSAAKTTVKVEKDRSGLETLGVAIGTGRDAESFYLPLGPHSSEIEAARAAWSLLGEWCAREDVKWVGRLSSVTGS
ncbi:hypothetical protein MMC25_000691 [Agyrium rufum]|nr:hypothetical protein [Agyrium rufum]